MPENALRRWVLALCLISLFGGVYFLTYRGFPDSLDELALFSSTESRVKAGNDRLVSLYHEYAYSGNAYIVNVTPWRESVHEPFQPILVSPFYWLAQRVDGLGLVHTVWLFNLFVTLGILLTLYGGGLSLGYSDSASFLVAVLAGFGTLLWHYSQTFFREPLTAWLMLLAYLLALHFKQRRHWGLILLLGVVWLVALQTKNIAITLLPVFLWLWLPHILSRKQMAGLLIIITLMLLGILIVLGNIEGGTVNLVYRGRVLSADSDYVLAVLGGYLISPGRSLWAGSPILLLSIYGAWLTYKKGQGRVALAPFLLLLAVVVIYAFGGRDWHGGRGWGSRYLVPVIPIMALSLLPVLEALLAGHLSLRWRWGVAGLFIFAVIVQLGGVLAPLEPYYIVIQQAFPDDVLKGLYDYSTWQPRYSQAYVSLSQLGHYPLAVAWRYAESPWHGVGVSLGLLLWSGLTYGLYRGQKLTSRRLLFLSLFTPFLMVLGFGTALSTLGQDQRLLGDRPELHALLAEMEQRVQPDDLIYLSDPSYRDFFLNFYKGEARFVTLPFAPGERYSFEQTPQVQTDFPDERLNQEILFALVYGVWHYKTVWLVNNLSHFNEWAYRPVEHYLARHFYPVENIETAANARLIRFSTLPAPAYDYRYHTLYITEHDPYQFGEGILLRGYDVPTQAQAGEVLPIVLWWETEETPDFDYNIGVFLINAEGVLVAQHDGQPQGTFGYTSRWAVGVPQGDNHGILLPATLPPGTYTIQVVMYDWRDASRLPVRYKGELVTEQAAPIAEVEIRP